MLKLTYKLAVMNWLRKRALLVLALMVIWTALPSLACAIPANETQLPACCCGMGHSCTHMKDMHGSCCHLNHQNPAMEAIPPFSPEHTHHLVFAAYILLPLPTLGNQASLTTIPALPVPTASPGSSTNLRI